MSADLTDRHRFAALAAQDADATFRGELERQFGCNACTRRYDVTQRGWDAATVAAGEAYERASAARNEAYRAMIGADRPQVPR